MKMTTTSITQLFENGSNVYERRTFGENEIPMLDAQISVPKLVNIVSKFLVLLYWLDFIFPQNSILEIFKVFFQSFCRL